VVTDNSSSNHSSGASSSGSTDTGKASSTSSLTHKLASLGIGNKEGKGEKEHKRTFSLPGRSQGNKDKQKEGVAKSKDSKANKDVIQQNLDSGDNGLGWAGCPRLCETPLLEPVVVKKIAHERLTSLVFKEECIVTACQDGYVCTWARPGRGGSTQNRTNTEETNNHFLPQSGTNSSHCSGSPTPINQGGTGTVV